MKLKGLPAIALLWRLSTVHAHGVHPKASDVKPDPDWATQHMLEEHHIDSFDPLSFFTLHDFNSDGHWDQSEVRLFYGLDSPQEDHHKTDENHKQHAIADVFALFDPDGSGMISRASWLEQWKLGKRLPDFGLGPGHHGDDEYEYEIHHFEKYHGEDAKEEDLTHPEDIEHFKMHDRLEDERARVERIEHSEGIVDENIPLKFKKQQ